MIHHQEKPMPQTHPEFNYEPSMLKREKASHYISATPKEEKEMQQFLGLENSDQVFDHIDDNVKFSDFNCECGHQNEGMHRFVADSIINNIKEIV